MTTLMRRLGWLVPLIAVVAAAHARGQAPSRTGLIVGQVVDATTSKPVPDAIVTVTTPFASINLPTTPRGRVMTDAQGMFFFADLPATPTDVKQASGYAINASKPGYVDSFYGKRRPAGGLVYFDLAEGERRNDAKILMWKYATISGTVLDENGEPVVGVTVRALNRSSTNGGARTVGVPAGSGMPGTTDDRGVYRISTLVPGDYVVVVPSTQATFPASALASVFNGSGRQSPLLNEMSAASLELTPLGMARNQQIGDVVLMTLNRTAIPPAPTGSGSVSVYQTMFHPSALAASEASTIALAAGEDRTGVDFQLRPVRAVRVSGNLTGPNGPVGSTAVRLVPASVVDFTSESGFETVTGLADAAGVFTLLGVPPGQYVLRVNKRPTPTGSDMLPSGVDPSVVWASEAVTVGDTDVRDLAVTVRSLLPVSGRFQFEGSQPAPAMKELGGLIVRLPAAGSGAVSTSTQIDANGSWAIGVPGGRYSLRLQPPAGWYVKSVVLGGRDISDEPLDIRAADMPTMVITCTDVAAQLSGVTRTAQGAPDPTATVVVFPIDRGLWSGLGPLMRLRAARATRTGAYTLTDLPPGEYYVAAMDDARAENWQDPKSLDALSRGAARVMIGVGEKQTLDVRER
jgi:Carboxypeptidase regulatory-like domain